MLHYYFDWDRSKDKRNIRKHKLSFRRAASIFHDPNQLTIYDEEHSSDDEERWITIGIDSGGVLRTVVNTFLQIEENKREIRLISARKAKPKEIRQYKKGTTI
jgi:uncharacterized DUF497 family protein